MAKSAISVTLPTDLIQWIDGQVKKGKFKSRAAALEIALLKLKGEAEGIELDAGLAESRVRKGEEVQRR